MLKGEKHYKKGSSYKEKEGALIASFELQCLSSFSHQSRRECMHTTRPGGDIRENSVGV
jgi:hypothetical protein